MKVPVPQAELKAESEDIYALEDDSTAAPAAAPQQGATAPGTRPGALEQTTPRKSTSDPSRARPLTGAMREAERRTSTREYLHLALLLALIPLIMSFLSPQETKIEDRLKATIERAGPETLSRVRALETRENADLDDLLEILPEGKLDTTAHLPRATWVHWAYGAIAAAGFWIFTLLLFPSEKRSPHHLLLVGLFTGTCGIVLLAGVPVRRGSDPGNVAARPRHHHDRLLHRQVHRLVVCLGKRPGVEPPSQLRRLHLRGRALRGALQGAADSGPLSSRWAVGLAWGGSLGAGIRGRVWRGGRDHVLLSLL